MSYILEALKKAEAEREKGHVPGLRSQDWSSQAAQPTAGTRPNQLTWALGVAVLVAAGVGFALWQQHRAPESPPPPQVAPSSEWPALAQPQVAAASQASATPVSPPSPTPALAPAPVAAAPAVAKPKVPKPLASAASAPEGVLAWAELPASVRQKLPKLQWGGAMYSPEPSARMVIINDHVLREGDQVAPGVILEAIEAKSVVLKVQGQRARWGG